MKLLASLILFSNSLCSQVWIPLADFPGSKRDDGVAVVVKDKAYVGTGLQEWNATIDFYVLDLKTFSWNTIPTMPHTTERQYACAFAGEDCFFVFGGDGVGGALNNLYKFDILNSSWTAKSSKPGLGSIGASCMSFGDTVIFVGGKSQTGTVDRKVWQYTISSDTWQQKNDLPFIGRWRANATVYNNVGYFMFGIDSANSYRKECYSYNRLTDQWTKLMDLPFTPGRAYASLSLAHFNLVVFGGKDSLGNYYKDLWYFNTNSATWHQGPDLPAAPRKGGMSFGYDEGMFYTCGITSSDVRLTETWMTHVPVGIVETNHLSEFSFSPNPVETTIKLSFKNSSIDFTKLKFRLTSSAAVEVISLSDLNNEGTIQLNSIPKGFYLLSIYSEARWLGTVKLIKN